ncbi:MULTISPECIES: class I SAM-dependent methyltransferase [unclassified Streptomyces]|uniref:class I SAM-dependent methyltransferase n=1 Tax=unclassified Streptomyces TaxID=2593676 RepID=UPI003814B3DE
MATATDHYEDLLADQYTWMLGGDITSVAEGQASLLKGLGVLPDEDHTEAAGHAIDLGCGPGVQSLALAALGFSPVTAVDTSGKLLAELTRCTGENSPIRPLNADIRTALPRIAAPGTAAAVLCMGDTLPHLPTPSDVPALLADVHRALAPGGHFVITYRDLSAPLEGTDRFLPVRSDENRLLTCFLEYVDEDTVMVHDLLHTRADGEWTLRTSSYPKLRIPAERLAAQCREAGLEISHDAAGARGMRVLHARKP